MAAKIMTTNKGRLLVFAGFFVVCSAVGFALGWLKGSGTIQLAQQTLIWWVLPVAIIFAVFSFWSGAVWMKSIDEAAQEAHKWAWYWGGTAGLTLAVVFYVLHFLPESARWNVPTLTGRTDPVSYAVAGGVFVVTLMIIGYVIAWAIWWFKRR